MTVDEIIEEAQKQFESECKSHFGRDEFLQKEDGFYTCHSTATAYFWFKKGIDAPRFAHHESAATKWNNYDPENLSDDLIDAEGCWHLIDCGEYIGTSRWCNQRHWLDNDTAVVKRFARVWI